MKFMKEEDVLALVEGQEDILTPAWRKKVEFFKKIRCPACHSSVRSEVSVKDLENARPDEPVPYGHARCSACGCLFDPDTELVIERGNIANAIEPASALINPPAGSGSDSRRGNH